MAWGPDVLAPLLPEHLEGMPVVGVPSIHTTSASFTLWIASRMSSVPSKKCVTSSTPSMNNERADPRELTADGVHEMQREPGEAGDRAADVGDHEDLGLGRPRVLELGLGWHAAVAQRVAHGVAEVERALTAVAPLASQADRQLAVESVDRLPEEFHLVPARA